jgi:outer membrane protein TolC
MSTRIRRTVLLTAAAVVGGVAGCADDLREVDRRTDELVRARSERVGGGAVSPSRRFDDGRAGAPSSALEKQPVTVNPTADELRFSPAAESRDVAARLEAYQRQGERVRRLGLSGAFKQAQLTAREYLSAEEEYILAAIRLLIARHSFDPRLFATTSVGVVATGTDGRFETPLRIMQELGVAKQFENGGRVEARLLFDATEQLRTAATDRYTQAASLVLSGSIPLLRGGGDVAAEEVISAERELVYAARTFEEFRRSFLVNIAADYFALIQSRAAIANQERQLASLKNLEDRTAALVAAGRTAEFEKNIASNRVLSATSSLANLRESYILALDRFKIRLGLGPDEALELEAVDLNLPEPEVTPSAAVEAALAYRLDLQTRRDRLLDARRGVANARNATLPDLNVSGSVGSRTKPSAREGGLVFETDDFTYSGGVTFGLPLDRENERLALRAAVIGLEQRTRELDQFRDNIVVEVRARVRDLDRARFNLTLAEQAVQINRRRLEEQELKRAEVAPQSIVDTENDLLNAENARDQALSDLRNAVLGYLVSTGQLRVTLDGDFQPIPGMQPDPAAP